MKNEETVTIQEFTYETEVSHNNEQIGAMFNALFPNLTVPHQVIYETMLFLQETKVNPLVIPKVIRGVHNVMIGTGKGQVIVHIDGDKANVSVRETDVEFDASR
jgi:hypothetical protein